MAMQVFPNGAKISLRAVELASSVVPGVEAKSTTTFSLMYRLPYSSTLLIYDDETKDYITKTFKPGDLSPQNDLVNIDTTSKDYNAFRINDYINRGFFSPITLTLVSGSTAGGTTSVDLNSLYIWTDNRIDAGGANWTHYEFSTGWISSINTLYYVSTHVADGSSSSIFSYDLNNSQPLDEISIDTPGVSFTNPVVTSAETTLCLANLDFWGPEDPAVHHKTWAIGECPIGNFNMNFMLDAQNAINEIAINGLIDVSALLIDDADNLFAVASDGVYAISKHESYVATKIYDGGGLPSGGAYYDLASRYICFIENSEGTFFTKITTEGILVSQTPISISSPVASCGVMLDNYMVTDKGQLIDMTDNTFGSVTNMDYNNAPNLLSFFDGTINQGKLNDSPTRMCINYDIHNPSWTDPDFSYGEVYFFDYTVDPPA